MTPNAPPKAAPMKRLGAKTPPEPPEASVKVVARALQTTSARSASRPMEIAPVSLLLVIVLYASGLRSERMVS